MNRALCIHHGFNAGRIALLEASLGDIEKSVVIEASFDELVVHSQMHHIGNFGGKSVGDHGDEAVHAQGHQRQGEHVVTGNHQEVSRFVSEQVHNLFHLTGSLLYTDDIVTFFGNADGSCSICVTGSTTGQHGRDG